MCGRRSRRPGGANDGDKKEEATAVVVEQEEAPGLEVVEEATGLKVWLLTVLIRRTKISPLFELEGRNARSGG